MKECRLSFSVPAYKAKFSASIHGKRYVLKNIVEASVISESKICNTDLCHGGVLSARIKKEPVFAYAKTDSPEIDPITVQRKRGCRKSDDLI